jgi:hypothetical protein
VVANNAAFKLVLVTGLSKLFFRVFDTLLQPCNKSLDTVRGQADNDIDKSETGSFETACRRLTDLVCPLIPSTLKIEYETPGHTCLVAVVSSRYGFVSSRFPVVFSRFLFVPSRFIVVSTEKLVVI